MKKKFDKGTLFTIGSLILGAVGMIYDHLRSNYEEEELMREIDARIDEKLGIESQSDEES